MACLTTDETFGIGKLSYRKEVNLHIIYEANKQRERERRREGITYIT